jgi:hypothetical protein
VLAVVNTNVFDASPALKHPITVVGVFAVWSGVAVCVSAGGTSLVRLHAPAAVSAMATPHNHLPRVFGSRFMTLFTLLSGVIA